MAQGQPAVAVATPPEQISWANRDAAVQTRPRAQRSILIVDDIDTNRDILVRFLEQLGHRVEESATGQNAIVKAVSHPFDLILMDIDLPDMTGWRAATAIKASGSASAAACVVAVSGHAYLQDVAASGAVGMSGHLTKPVEFEKLKELIRQLDPS
jgi:CheY-like chemotaxis protein